MFVAYNKVRMHDTDMAGILYFPRQFRFVHDALEDLLNNEGLSFERVFHEEEFVFVIAHAEADYLAPLKVGDAIEVHVSVDRIGTTSFTMDYKIYKADKSLVGTAKTVHVSLNAKTRKKIHIPEKLRKMLLKFASENLASQTTKGT